jgi:hypothetical protein
MMRRRHFKNAKARRPEEENMPAALRLYSRLFVSIRGHIKRKTRHGRKDAVAGEVTQ